MTGQPPTIFLSAAEPSGDEHAAGLIRAIRQRLPNARLIGVGGQEMADAGCEIIIDLVTQATMAGAVLPRLVYWTRTIRKIKREIQRIRPDLHVPVDSPMLNWHLAAASKQVGTPVMYLIAPQIWAWAPWRIEKLRRLTDRVACILPFEEAHLRQRGVNATYVGHPLFDTLPHPLNPLPDITDAWASGDWEIALLPGSRPAEIRHHTPALMHVARAIMRRWRHAKCTLPVRTPACAVDAHRACDDTDVHIVVGRARQVLARSHFAVAGSGTVTLEAANFGVPMVVFYHITRRMKMVGKAFVCTNRFSLVNILAGRSIVPEVIPWHGDPAQIETIVMDVLDDLGFLLEARENLLKIVEPLRLPAPQTAAGNAADMVVEMLGR